MARVLVIIAAFVVLHFVRPKLSGAWYQWFKQWAGWANVSFQSERYINPYLLYLGIAGLPVLALLVVSLLLSGFLWGLFNLIFSVVLMIYFASSYNDYLTAETPDPERSVRFQQSFLALSFWYFVFGSVGLIAYAVIWWLSSLVTNELDISVHNVAHKIYHIVNWIPARVCALLFALTGNFGKTFSVFVRSALDPDVPGDNLVSSCALAAEDETEQRFLVERSLYTLLALYALLGVMQLF